MSRSPDHLPGPRPYLEELCAIGVTCLLGALAVILYSNKNLYVFWSGLAILTLAASRSILLFLSFIQEGYRREPGPIPWRCFVLIFPILLFFFGPPATSANSIRARSKAQNAIHMTWDDL